MPLAGRVAIFAGFIVLGALAGGSIPLFSGQARRVVFLAFAAGVMLGAAFFHMLPEAFHEGGYAAFSWVPAGFVLLFLLERYVLVHACEEPPDCAEHPGATLGLTAFFGLSAHTLFDGIALASACAEGVGFMAFVAILAHKVPSSLSLASILRAEDRSRPATLLLVTAFGLMVPLGAALYFVLNAAVHLETMAAKSLAFSCGTFLYIAVSDLLPHVNRHGKQGRLANIAALLFGLSLMFALTAFTHEPHA